MSELVHLVVEGSKDAYFLHELLRQRFADELTQENPKPDVDLSYKTNELLTFLHRSCGRDVLYRICVNNGYTAEGNLKKWLSDTDKQRKLVCTALIFDSDTTGSAADAGQAARKEFLRGLIDKLLADNKQENVDSAENTEIFLFPNPDEDGDLESIMEGMALPMHRRYFSICWRAFQLLLSFCSYLKLSNKSKIYDYVEAMYAKTNRIARVKDYQGYNKNMRATGLWDWHAESLKPLKDFLDGLLRKY